MIDDDQSLFLKPVADPDPVESGCVGLICIRIRKELRAGFGICKSSDPDPANRSDPVLSLKTGPKSL